MFVLEGVNCVWEEVYIAGLIPFVFRWIIKHIVQISDCVGYGLWRHLVRYHPSKLDCNDVQMTYRWRTKYLPKVGWGNKLSDDVQMTYRWCTDDVQMMYRLQSISWTVGSYDELMTYWWRTDDVLMMYWWCTDDVLMTYDDVLMTYYDVPWRTMTYHDVPWRTQWGQKSWWKMTYHDVFMTYRWRIWA